MIISTFVILSCKTLESSHISDAANYSFPVTGEVLETGNVASIIIPWFSLGRKNPLSETNIFLTGTIRRPFPRLSVRFLWMHKSQYQDDLIWILPKNRRLYRWDGTITIDGYSTKNVIEFHIHAGRNAAGKTFMLTNASLGQAVLEFDDPLEIFNSVTGNFPFLIGYAHLSKHSYRVFAVYDNSPTNWIPLNRAVFFNPFQKFQFLDEKDIVVAELEKDRYTIFDTLTEEDRADIKQAIALMIGFRHSATVMNNVNEGWSPPISRSVFP